MPYSNLGLVTHVVTCSQMILILRILGFPNPITGGHCHLFNFQGNIIELKPSLLCLTIFVPSTWKIKDKYIFCSNWFFILFYQNISHLLIVEIISLLPFCSVFHDFGMCGIKEFILMMSPQQEQVLELLSIGLLPSIYLIDSPLVMLISCKADHGYEPFI